MGRAKDYNIPIVSVGNLTIGGSGKTPFSIALSNELAMPVAIILRGYKRQNDAPFTQVSVAGRLLCDVADGGDEAIEIAQKVPCANVIVCKDRGFAIEKAKAQGVRYIILDDGFSKSSMAKFDILLESLEPYPQRVLPSGAYREFAFTKRYADYVAREERDFFREVRLPKVDDWSSALLLTAISKPERLERYVPNIKHKAYFPDHYDFAQQDIDHLIAQYSPKTLIMTAKDEVKIRKLILPKSVNIAIIELDIRISDDLLNAIKNYIQTS